MGLCKISINFQHREKFFNIAKILIIIVYKWFFNETNLKLPSKWAANQHWQSESGRNGARRAEEMSVQHQKGQNKFKTHKQQLEKEHRQERRKLARTPPVSTSAQPLSPNQLDDLERCVDEFKAFLAGQDRMRNMLSKKPKAHLLLSHFVPFARQHQFLGLLDEQGDEALHSVWRRLEQLWKCMPDKDQILQQLEHHFVSNWLHDSGRIEELKQTQRDQNDEDDQHELSDEDDELAQIDLDDF